MSNKVFCSVHLVARQSKHILGYYFCALKARGHAAVFKTRPQMSNKVFLFGPFCGLASNLLGYSLCALKARGNAARFLTVP